MTAFPTLALPKTLVAGTPENVNDLNSNLNQLLAWANRSAVGYNQVVGSESRTNTAYGTMPTADQVTGVTLNSGGLIAVAFQATWQESVTGNARAAIFLGSNQLVAPGGFAANLQEAEITAAVAANTNRLLVSAPFGLYAIAIAPVVSVTTGQAIGWQGDAGTVSAGGGPCYISAAAGNYTVSVQFKASSGSVTASNRQLWVWTLGD